MSTKRLVRERDRRGRTASPAGPGRPAAAGDRGSRGRLCAAAASEFAARGFAGASVDRIARGARVNKAMIYYHFRSKAALYQDILGDMFHAVVARVRLVAGSADPPEAKLVRFVEAIASEADARPHFPRIWFREVAEGGVHLDDRTLSDIAGIVQTLVAILEEGVRARRFKRVDPLLVHGGIVGPLLLYFASAALRQKLARAGMPAAAGVTREDVMAHVQRMTLGFVQGRV
jgi:TetR/AcrR family transcriptional regulator